MKKGSITLLLMLSFISTPAYSAIPVDFIYINGSNNNTEKAHDHFVKEVNNFHPELKKRLEKDSFTYEHMLKNGEYEIQSEPSIYFWGFKSRQALMNMQSNAQLLQSISPWMAYFVRNTLANIMHDAIWVTKSHNLIPILQELDEQVKADIKEGKKVVLFGYSAGTFITLEYIGQRVAYINIADWFNRFNLDNDIKTMIKNNPRKDTCATAFISSNITNVTALGKVVPNTNKEEFKKTYLDMDKYTDTYCIPMDSVIGIINHASPIPLFYSDLSESTTDSGAFLGMMYKYLIEHDFFFLTVNYADDPLGFPNGVNYRNEDIEQMHGIKFNNPKGFLYDYSRTLSWRTVAGAHTSYRSAKSRFSKAIIKGYTEGYNFQYGDNSNKK